MKRLILVFIFALIAADLFAWVGITKDRKYVQYSDDFHFVIFEENDINTHLEGIREGNGKLIVEGNEYPIVTNVLGVSYTDKGLISILFGREYSREFVIEIDGLKSTFKSYKVVNM